MDVNIRKGLRSDLPEVLGLIKELACYEQAPLEVVVSLEELERDGFGETPLYHFYVAINENTIIGMALYYIKYSTWKGKCIYLDDIIVSERYRGNKVGEKLFQEVIKVGKEMKVRKIEWQVLDWNAPAINFYKKFNSQMDDEWINCKIIEHQIQDFSSIRNPD